LAISIASLKIRKFNEQLLERFFQSVEWPLDSRESGYNGLSRLPPLEPAASAATRWIQDPKGIFPCWK
jgi:hypothetical protein